jgi:hypothetical protein
MMAKDRSPNYPAIPLGEAVELARRLYAAEKRTAVTPEAAVRAWGHGAVSGSARIRLGALRKYGLIDHGAQGLRVSDLALQLIQYPPDTSEYRAALREAALAPQLFRELRETHADASEHSLRAYLVTRKGFSETGAAQVIKAFRATMALAKLGDSGHIEDQTPEESASMATTTHERSPADLATAPPDATRGGKPRAYSWALSKDVSAELRIVGDPLTKAEAERLRQYVDLTLGALVVESS